jgi:protein-tyrosine kinase
MLRLKKFNRKKMENNTARSLITFTDAKSIVSEQFRTLRTNISFAVPDQDIQTILITSSVPGEGKSTIAANLGVVYAQEGRKVLIIDADMRKPTLHHTFEVFNGGGLSTVLSRQQEIGDSIKETPILGLDVMTSGPIPPNPAELLSSKTMNSIFEELKMRYDIIIFDAPPLLSLSDSQIISNKCDGTLLIINTGVSQTKDVKKAKNILKVSKARILGVILNNFKMTISGKYHY